MILEDDARCFACGKENLDGLRIDWKVEGETMRGEFVPEAKFQGWKGILHGGIAATLLDEAMSRLVGVLAGGAVTAEMTVRYVAPIPIGERLFIRGEVVKSSRRLSETRGVIEDGSGKVLAHATGKVAIISKR